MGTTSFKQLVKTLLLLYSLINIINTTILPIWSRSDTARRQWKRMPPWPLVNALVPLKRSFRLVYNFLRGCPLPWIKCLGALALSKTKHTSLLEVALLGIFQIFFSSFFILQDHFPSSRQRKYKKSLDRGASSRHNLSVLSLPNASKTSCKNLSFEEIVLPADILPLPVDLFFFRCKHCPPFLHGQPWVAQQQINPLKFCFLQSEGSFNDNPNPHQESSTQPVAKKRSER